MGDRKRSGTYRGVDWNQHRMCDVMDSKSRKLRYFIYADGVATGDHYKSLADLERFVDAALERTAWGHMGIW